MNQPPQQQNNRPVSTQSQQNHGSNDTFMKDASSTGNRSHNPQSRSPAVENRHQSRVDGNTSKAKANYTGLDKPPV